VARMGDVRNARKTSVSKLRERLFGRSGVDGRINRIFKKQGETVCCGTSSTNAHPGYYHLLKKDSAQWSNISPYDEILGFEFLDYVKLSVSIVGVEVKLLKSALDGGSYTPVTHRTCNWRGEGGIKNRDGHGGEKNS